MFLIIKTWSSLKNKEPKPWELSLKWWNMIKKGVDKILMIVNKVDPIDWFIYLLIISQKFILT